jgi:hypothetical protein
VKIVTLKLCLHPKDFLFFPSRFWEGKERMEGREKEMEGTDDGSVEPDPREWSSEKVATFVRSLGAAQCFQSAGDQVLQLGVDGSVVFDLSLNDLQGVCGHARAYDRMCACTHTVQMRVRAQYYTETDHSCTLS